jgi:thioesterase domain-containing protein
MHVPGPIDRTIEELARHVVSEIRQHLDPAFPCVIIGYSSGATIAFDAALQLDESGFDVRLVIVDAVPGLAGMPRIPSASGRSRRFIWRLRQIARRSAARRDRKRIDSLHLDPGPPGFEVNRYQVFMMIQVRAINAYTPRSAPFGATLIRVDGSPVDKYLSRLFPKFDIHIVNGDHRTMLMPAHVGEIAAVLAPLLPYPPGHRHRSPEE